MIAVERIEAPARLVQVDSVLSEHMRITEPAERQLADAYVSAAEARLDGYHGLLGRCLLRQRWAFPVHDKECVRLPFPDCREMVLAARQEDGSWVDVPGASVTVEGGGSRVRFCGLPAERDPIALLLVAGWDNAAAVPDALKQAIRMIAVEWFDLRRDAAFAEVHTMPHGATALIEQFHVSMI